MKKTILIVSTLFISTIGFSQAKFYTDNGTKPVTELTCNMSDIKVTVPIPETIGNHELVEIAIDYLPADKSHETTFAYAKEFKTSFLQGKKEISLWIKEPDSKSGEFCANFAFSNHSCYKIDQPCAWDKRDFTQSDVLVRVLGKDVSGYEWVRDVKQPTYKYTTLTTHKIKMTYGETIKNVYSVNKMFNVIKYIGGKFFAGITSQNNDDNVSVAYSSEFDAKKTDANVVIFNAYPIRAGSNTSGEIDFGDPSGGSAGTSQNVTVNDVKKSVAVNLLLNANPDAKGSVEEQKTGLYWGTHGTTSEIHLYEPFITKGENSKRAYESLLKSEGGKLKWKKGKVGNLDCEVLEIPVYDITQADENSQTPAIKSTEKGNTKTLLLFVGEKNGVIIAGSMFKAGKNKITEDEQKFWNHMLSTFQVL